MVSRWWRWIGLAVAIGGGTAGQVEAAIITFGFSGKLTYVEDRNSRLGGTLEAGDTFSGTYSFDPSVQDTEDGDPAHGYYPNALTVIAGEVNGIPLAGDGSGGFSRIEVRDDSYGADTYLARGMSTLLNIPLIFAVYVDVPTDSFTGDSILRVPSIDTALRTAFSLYTQEDGVVDIKGELDSLYLVPEPATLFFMAVGAVCFLRSRRDRLKA
jgi:hypothetical protein